MEKIKTQLTLLLIGTALFSGAQTSQITWKETLFKSKSGDSVIAELGNILVPENREVGKSRKIEIGFLRFKSTNPNPGNPIVYLAGGPGGSGIGAAKGPRFELFMKLREVSDVIALDQRGVGISNQIPPCQKRASIPLASPGSPESYVSAMAKAGKECLAFWRANGVQVEGYNTRENARDIEDLRIALGVDKLNLWGISYGSHLGFEFIKNFESSVERVVLTGLEGPDQTIKIPENNQRFLEALNEKIQQDAKAKKNYPNLIELMDRVHQKLDAEPKMVKVMDRRSKQELEVGISKFDVQLVTSFLLTKNPENSVRLPLTYHKMDNGDFSEMGQMVFMLRQYASRIDAMPLLMDAMSGVSQERYEKIEKQASEATLGRSTNFPFPDLGRKLGLPDLGDEFRKNPNSSVKALFFAGTLDGRTYLESAEEIQLEFENSNLVTVDGAGHDLFMCTPKIGELITQFFSGASIQSQRLEVNVPKFVLP